MEDIIPIIAPLATKRVVKKRTILLYQGEIPRSAYVLMKGVIKVYSINELGEEQIVSFHRSNDVLPLPWIFGASTSTTYYYEAVTECMVLTIPRSDVREAVESRPEILRKAFVSLVKEYTSMLMRITALEQSRAREKLMFTLYYLLFRFGEEQQSGLFKVELDLTHAVIANMVGLTRETTASELGRLKRDKVIRYNAREYVIDKAKLERLMGEDSFASLVR